MNQFEEFTKILYNQIQEEEIQGPAEEPNEEINLEEGEDNKINNNLIFQVKSKNDEKEVAKIHGINPKTLHRWMTKGLKKNQGK